MLLQQLALALPVVAYLLPWPSAAGWRHRLLVAWRVVQCFAGSLGLPLVWWEVGLVHTLIADAMTSSCGLLWDIEYVVPGARRRIIGNL